MKALKRSIASLIAASSLGSSVVFLLPNTAKAIPAWSKHCGPASMPEAAIAWNTLLYPWSPLFDSACKTHDENYDLVNSENNSANMTQRKADTIFKDEMNRLCENKWRDAIGLNGTAGDIAYGTAQLFSLGTFAPAMKTWCKSSALANYAMVAEFGADIGAATGFPSVKVTSARIYRSDDWLSDDEIKVQFTVKNDGNVDIEVDAVMMKKGKGYRHLVSQGVLGRIASALDSNIADTEPDTHEVDLHSGQSWSDTVDTNWGWPSQEDLDNPVNVFIRTDEWSKSGLLSNFTTAFTPKAWIQCPKPSPDKWGDCTVKYRVGDTWQTYTVNESARSTRQQFQTAQSSLTVSESGACNASNKYMGIWAFMDGSTKKYARGGVSAEGRNDLVGTLSPKINNSNKDWGSFKLYSIPGRRYGRRLQNTIDGRWLETVNATNSLLLHGPVRSCTTSNKDMQWDVIPVAGQRGIYKIKNLNNNRYVKATSSGLLKANASEAQATPFTWYKF